MRIHFGRRICGQPGLWVALSALILAAGAAIGQTPPNTPAGSSRGDDQRQLDELKVPLVQLGPGDVVAIQVYGQPDMSGTLYVSDDGTVPVALVGPVAVGGLSPADAASRIEAALRDAKILNEPHVTLTVTTSRSQRVSVLGEVAKPGRYPVESNATVLDVLAEAGGVTEAGGDTVYVLRPGADGQVARMPVNLKNFSDGATTTQAPLLRGGDSVFVPHAPQFYIYGEVTAPGKFKLETGMTVIEAIARAGGITVRGSQRRIDIKRRRADGTYETSGARLSDLVRPDDVIRVKESIF